MKKHLFALPLFAAVFFLYSCASVKKEAQPAPEPPIPEKPVTFDYEIKTKKSSTRYLESEIKYPVFENNDALNKAVKQEILSGYDNVLKNAESDWNEQFFEKSPDDRTIAYEYFGSPEKIISTEKLFCIVFDEYIYYGGAHGSPQKITLCFSKKNNKKLSITQASGLSLEEISRLCYETLLSMMAEDEFSDLAWLQEGTEPMEENYECFYIENNILTVIFNPYQVAPYAYGTLAVQIEL
ncbi:MAG: DUF3298 and DUF4163 domain-containing protein [Treponema sp.]|nr:DUF3298 and DUF4163 domain-containing protein [Treponema sp.]